MESNQDGQANDWNGNWSVDYSNGDYGVDYAGLCRQPCFPFLSWLLVIYCFIPAAIDGRFDWTPAVSLAFILYSSIGSICLAVALPSFYPASPGRLSRQRSAFKIPLKQFGYWMLNRPMEHRRRFQAEVSRAWPPGGSTAAFPTQFGFGWMWNDWRRHLECIGFPCRIDECTM